MSEFRSLSVAVRELQGTARRKLGLTAPPADADAVRAAAGAIVMTAGADPSSAWINVAAVAALTLDRLLVYQVKAPVSRLIDETDLRSVPSEPPRMFRRPWIAEVRHPEQGERLWGDVVSLGGYPWQDGVMLVALTYPDGARVGLWPARWEGGEIDAQVPADRSPLIADVDAHQQWMREAVRWSVLLALLLEADAAPLRTREEVERPIGPAKGKGGKAPEWITRHVYLDERKVDGRPALGGGAPAAGARVPAEAMVRGHLKRQHHGPGRKSIKWIYVAAYEARRWVAPRPTRVVVDLRGDQP